MKVVWRVKVILLLSLVLCLTFATHLRAQTVAPPITPADFSPAIVSIRVEVFNPAQPLLSPSPAITYVDVRVSIQVSGFIVSQRIGQPNVPGEGHIIYYLAEPQTFPDLAAYTASGTHTSGTSTLTYTWENYNYNIGEYWIFAAQLVNNDDTPLNPPVYAMVVTHLPAPGQVATKPAISEFTLTAGPPANPPASPSAGTTYMDVEVDVKSAGLEMVSWEEGAPLPPDAPGQGHLMYYWYVNPLTVPTWFAFVSDEYSFYRTISPFTFDNAIAGYNVFSVQLVSNENRPLVPPEYAILAGNFTIGSGPSTVFPRPDSSSILDTPSG